MATAGEAQDVASIWQELSAGIRDVYAHREMTSKRFMQLYTYCFTTLYYMKFIELIITIAHFVVFPVMYTTIAHEIQLELMPLAEEADVLGD